MSTLSELLVEVRGAAARFEADRWSADECVRLAEELSRAAKSCAAASARAAARAVECGRSDVEWVARHVGSTPGQARETLATTAALGGCTATSAAVAEGAVSLVQAKEIVAAEAVVPGSERVLLEVAAASGMAGLRAASRKVRLANVDREELHRRQWSSRSLRHWVDGEGMVAGQFRLPPEVGVPFVNRVDAEADRVHRAERTRGSTESREAHAADALMAVVRDGGKGRAGRSDVVFVCSLDAYRRGHTHDGDVSHVIGSGPVPVQVVRDAVEGDAFVKAVVLKGVEIHSIAHLGRRMPAELRTALELGPAPSFEGVVCVEEACDRRHRLEWDHVDPVAHGGLTSSANVQPRCGPHHREKTARDRTSGLLDAGRAPPSAS